MDALSLSLFNPVGTAIIYTGIAFACIAAIALVLFLARIFNCRNCCYRRRQDGSQEWLIERGRYPGPRSYYSTASTTAWTTTNETVATRQKYTRPPANISPRYSVIKTANASKIIHKKAVLPPALPGKSNNVPPKAKNEKYRSAVTSALKVGYPHLKDEKNTSIPARKNEDRQHTGTPAPAPSAVVRPTSRSKASRTPKRPVPIPPHRNALRLLRNAGATGTMPDIDKLDGIRSNRNSYRLATGKSILLVRGNNPSPPRLLVPAKRANKVIPRQPRFTQELESLTIATDATPFNVGGYCVDFASHTCNYYSFPTSMLPQCLEVKEHFDSAEFEMNNLAFALFYWEPLILERERLHLYTDNSSIRANGISPEHGEKVRIYLNHLEKCAGVRVLNMWKHHINKNQRPADFEKYIVPADDLSRRNIEGFAEKIVKSFPKIREFSQMDMDLLVAKEVQERWENHAGKPCHCGKASFYNNPEDERVKGLLVRGDRNSGGKKFPKVKRLNRK